MRLMRPEALRREKSGWRWLHRRALLAMAAAVAGCLMEEAPPARLSAPKPTLLRTVPGMIFPLVPGAEWVYEGRIRWSEGKETFSKNVLWTMKVVEMLERDGYSVYVVKGFPTDIAWNTALEMQDSVIVRAGDRYYKSGPAAYLHIRQGNDISSLIHEEEAILDFPLERGKVYGAASAAAREEQRGCWVVEEVQAVDLTAISGAGEKRGQSHRLVFKSLSDRLRLDFVPNLGFVAVSYFNYRHPFEAELRLIKFKMPTAKKSLDRS